MATVNKDFKIKSGLIVEGATGTIGGYDILTKKTDDQNYIIGLIGGSATSNATPNTVVLRDGAGSFSANVITASTFNGDVLGTVSDISNHDTDSLAEGTTNLYYANSLAREAFSGGDGIAYDSATGVIEADLGNGIAFGPAAEIIIDRTTVDTWYDASGTGASEAANAYTSATSYTDNAITNLNLGGTYDALGAADTAYNNAIAYAEGYTDNAVAALVDSAPEMLDTLNELAQALQDNPNVIADLQDVAAGKQDALTAGNGIDIDGSSNISVDPYDLIGTLDPSYVDLDIKNGKIGINQGTLTTYTNTLYDAAGAAANALANANSYTDNAISNLDLVFTTDDVSEANNLYFTDSRAKDAAGNLLASASTTNVTISYSPLTQQLTVEAENGVADSTTDDLNEGSSNLYFSNVRAVAALEAVVPNFEAIEIDSIAKQIATYTEAPTAGVQVLHTFLPFQYRAAEYLVKISHASDNEISKVLVTVDSANNVAVTEYGIVSTNGALASSVSADFSGGNVRLLATTLNNDSTVKTVGTLLS